MKKKRLIDPDTLVLLKQIGKGFVVLVVAGLTVTAIWHGTRLPSVTLKVINVEGGETIDHNEITKKISTQLDGNYLGLVPRRFAWLFPKDDIYNVVQSVPRVHDVSVYRVSGTELQVSFNEYTPNALWCDSENDDSDCFFIDKTGYAFADAPALSGGSFTRFVFLNRKATVDEKLLDEEPFLALLELSSLLSTQGWYVSYIELDQVGDVFLKIVGGGELKVLAADEPERVVENLSVILSSPEFQHIEPGNFEYIDLRFGNKVFVNEELVDSEDESTSENTASSTSED